MCPSSECTEIDTDRGERVFMRSRVQPGTDDDRIPTYVQTHRVSAVNVAMDGWMDGWIGGWVKTVGRSVGGL